MGVDQPAEPEVQPLGDPVVPVVNPPVGQNDNENVAQPRELKVVVFQSLFDASRYTSLSVDSFRFFSYNEVERLLEGFGTGNNLLSKLVARVVDLFDVVS